MIEAKSKNDISTTLHEIGRNFGFMFQKDSYNGDPLHSKDPTHLMYGESGGGTKVNGEDFKNVWGGVPPYNDNGTYHRGKGKARQDAIKFFNDSNATYNEDKAKKAGL